MKRNGFTLIEVLVAIVIIMILVALLFPAFGGAKNRAKETVCISNMRQIYSALKLYQADYDEYPPGNSFGWVGLGSYYPTLLRCPSSKQRFATYDYNANWSGFGFPLTPPEIPYQEAWIECRNMRAGDFPIVFDFNHALETGTPHYLLVRENGSIKTVVVPSSPLGQPCSSKYAEDNWNY